MFRAWGSGFGAVVLYTIKPTPFFRDIFHYIRLELNGWVNWG